MTTLDLQVSASVDDAHERQDETDYSATFTIGLFIAAGIGSHWRWDAGMRFQNVTIPQGSKIDAAYISVRCTTNNVDDPNIDIYCEDVDDAANFTTTPDVHNRVVTTASTSWVATGLGTGWINSPSLVDEIQEVIDRPGWASGNALMVICKGKSNTGTNFVIWPYDGSTTKAAKLHIEYSSGVRSISVSESIAVTDTVSKPVLDPMVDALLYNTESITVGEEVIVQIAPDDFTATALSRQEVNYVVWLDDQYGKRLALLENLIDFEIVKVANSISYCQVTLPGTFDQNLLGLDHLVEFWRAPVGGELRLETVFFVRFITYTEDRAGNDVISLSGPDANDLLNRRIVAYAAGTSQASKADYADDMMKEIVAENLGASATDTDRDLSALNFTIAGDVSAAGGVEKSFAWRNVFDVLTDLAAMSAETGAELYFDVVPKVISASAIGFEFRTYTNQPGLDRTYTSNNPVIFSKEWGNLVEPILEFDYNDEVNYVYAGGQGEADDRVIEEQTDLARIGASVWNRRERFRDARNEGTADRVSYRGEEALNEGRPTQLFKATLLDTPQSRYGKDWSFGDRVIVSYHGIQMEGVIQAVRLTLDQEGTEDIDVKMELAS